MAFIKQKMSNISWFQLLKCEDLLLFSVLYEFKWIFWGLGLLGGHLEQWETVIAVCHFCVLFDRLKGLIEGKNH